MVDLSGEPVAAPEEPPAGDDPASDPRPHGDQQHVVRTPARPEPELAPGGHVGVVVHERGEADSGADPLRQRKLPPREVRGEPHHAAEVHHAGRPHPERGHIVPPGHQLAGQRHDRPRGGFRVGGRGLGSAAVQDAAAALHAHQQGLDLRPTRVDPDGYRSRHAGERTRPVRV